MTEIASFLITFREALEASLVVGVILAYLARSGQHKYSRFVYLGTAAGVLGSVVAAILFSALAGGFTGAAEQIFEGVTMITGASLITIMIFWMMNQKGITGKLESRVKADVSESRTFGLFLLAFFSVLREGVETVLFLGAAAFAGGGGYSIAGAIGGIAAAIALGYVIFAGLKKVDLRKLFLATGILLIFFAAGLVASAVHEFEEAGIVPPIVEHMWDLNPPQNPDGSYPPLHENGDIGGIFKGLFGYNGNPSLASAAGYLAYVAIIAAIYMMMTKRPARRARG